MSAELVEALGPFVEAARSLRGWRLDYEPRALDPGPPWDYTGLARGLVAECDRVLDLGTGGGELLERVLDGARARAVATEPWAPNAPVAVRRLRGRASVVRASSLGLPFASRAFDGVLARNEELAPAELVRVLAPGGRLLSEQVHPDYWPELREWLPDFGRFPAHHQSYPRELEAAGASIERFRTQRRRVCFDALGPLVYHLVACPWNLPGFDPEAPTHADALAALDARFRRDGPLVLTERCYLLQARVAG